MPRVILPALCLIPVLFAQTTGSVEGVVENSVTHAPIPGVVVTVYTRQGSLYDATTDASGAFSIFAMKPGNYEVRFEKEGFIQGRKAPPQPYPVGQGRDPIRMRLGMVQQVSLHGRVVDADGNPFSPADVKLSIGLTMPVSSDGSFAFDRLEPGSYTLIATPKSKGTSEGDRVPVTTYYPASIDAAGAQPIVIRGDGDLSGYEVRLQTAEAYSVRGVVLDETGNPKAGVTVRLHPSVQNGSRVVASGDFITMVGPGPSAGTEEAQVVSKADGSFEFPSVRSGEWHVAALFMPPVESPNAMNSFRNGAEEVVVGRRNVDNLQIRMATPFNLAWTADWGSAPSRRAGIFLSATDGRTGIPSLFGEGNATAANETLTMRVSPGKYIIVPRPGPGYYPVSVLLAGQEVLGKPVDLLAAAPLRIAYKTAEGSVRGTVVNGQEDYVMLIPRDVRSMGFGRILRCKVDGTFEMSGVPPGDYFIAAFEQLQRSVPSLDAAWLAHIASIGTPVSVAQNPVSVQLKLNRWPE